MDFILFLFLFLFLFAFFLFSSFNLRLGYSIMSYICHMLQKNVEDFGMMISYHISIVCSIYAL